VAAADRIRRLLVAAAPWPLISALGSPAFRRVQGHRKTAKQAAYLSLYSLTVAVSISRSPRLARRFAIVAGLGTIAELWVMRSAFGRYRVPRGWWLHLSVNESHRDSSVFASAETFDPDRFDQRRYTTAEYAPGMFEHSCLGVPTTYAIAAAFVREYCELDWTLCDDAEPEYDGFHWTPSRRLRIRLP
jgi:hypothetical protein